MRFEKSAEVSRTVKRGIFRVSLRSAPEVSELDLPQERPLLDPEQSPGEPLAERASFAEREREALTLSVHPRHVDAGRPVARREPLELRRGAEDRVHSPPAERG